MSLPIVYCMMEMNRLYEVKKCIDLVEPYVDEVVIVDGGSQDDSIFYLRNREGIHMFIHPWTDVFSEQRNKYLMRAREVVGGDFWALTSDPDEFFEKDLLAALPSVRDRCEREGYNMAAFQCRSVTLKGDVRVWENLDNYWKPLFFKVTPGTHYEGNPHETTVLPGGRRCVNTSFVYEHVKQENVIWHRGCRNMYIGGGGPNLGTRNELWNKLNSIVASIYGRKLPWNDFEKEMIKGNIHPEIKEWLIKARLEKDYDGSSEMRESYKLYFRIFHPEEEPEELRGEYIP